MFIALILAIILSIGFHLSFGWAVLAVLGSMMLCGAVIAVIDRWF